MTVAPGLIQSALTIRVASRRQRQHGDRRIGYREGGSAVREVRDRDGRVGGQQQLGHRLAVKRLERPMTTACLPPGSSTPRLGEQAHAAGRACTAAAPRARVPGSRRQRRQPVDVLACVNRPVRWTPFEMVGCRELGRGCRRRCHHRSSCSISASTYSVLRVGGAARDGRTDPGLTRGLALVGDVDRAGRILADEDRRQAWQVARRRRAAAGAGGERRDVPGHLLPDLRRDRLARR